MGIAYAPVKVMNAEEERGKRNTGYELEVENKNLKREMSEDFNISQEETGFPLLK